MGSFASNTGSIRRTLSHLGKKLQHSHIFSTYSVKSCHAIRYFSPNKPQPYKTLFHEALGIGQFKDMQANVFGAQGTKNRFSLTFYKFIIYNFQS